MQINITDSEISGQAQSVLQSKASIDMDSLMNNLSKPSLPQHTSATSKAPQLDGASKFKTFLNKIYIK